MPEKHYHTGYCRNTYCWHHRIITVQGIRNDDQSLSPVTPLTFSNPIQGHLLVSYSYVMTASAVTGLQSRHTRGCKAPAQLRVD